jgi:hypothetical protein
VSNREFYIGRAAKCLLASEQVGQPADRAAMLHMAASYVTLAIEVELRETRGEVSAPAPKYQPPPMSNRDPPGAS